jgi:hypothetical protein
MPRATIMLAAALLLMAAGGREVTNNPPRRDRAGAQGAPSSVERQEGRVAKPLGVPRQPKVSSKKTPSESIRSVAKYRQHGCDQGEGSDRADAKPRRGFRHYRQAMLA